MNGEGVVETGCGRRQECEMKDDDGCIGEAALLSEERCAAAETRPRPTADA